MSETLVRQYDYYGTKPHRPYQGPLITYFREGRRNRLLYKYLKKTFFSPLPGSYD